MSSDSSPYSFLRSKKGGRERASTKPRGEDERVIHDQEDISEGKGVLPTQPMGSVGLSLTIGMATKFAREKIEITVWESQPVYMDPADKERARKEIADNLSREAQMRLDAVVHQFFPNFAELVKEED